MGLGGFEGGRAAGPLLAAPVLDGGTLGGSKSPKASCHSLLNSSLAPGPGLRRSLRKAMSPRSPSSSSSPVSAGWGEPSESRHPSRGKRERQEGGFIRPEANTSQLILKGPDVPPHQLEADEDPSRDADSYKAKRKKEG